MGMSGTITTTDECLMRVPSTGICVIDHPARREVFRTDFSLLKYMLASLHPEGRPRGDNTLATIGEVDRLDAKRLACLCVFPSLLPCLHTPVSFRWGVFVLMVSVVDRQRIISEQCVTPRPWPPPPSPHHATGARHPPLALSSALCPYTRP
jgi:hypothetical protein